MGFFSALGRTFGIGAGDPAEEAAAQIAAANAAAKKELTTQFEATQGRLDPFVQAGTGALPDVIQGATAGGLDERLREIFGGESFQNLVGERTRAVQGQLAAGGLTRSGTALQEIANVPTELGFNIENLLAGRQAGLAGQGFGAATGLGQFGQTFARDVSGITRATGQAQASGTLGGAQAEAAGVQNALRGISGGLTGLFSDRNLKENIVKTGEFKGMNVYKWNWIPEVKGTIVEDSATVGFIADEVREKYPQYVYEFGGFDIIDYPMLLNDLEAA